MSLMGTVRIRARRGISEPQNEDGRIVLRGETEWLFSGPEAPLQELEHALGSLAEPIGNELLVSFGNSVGFFQLPELGLVEVRSRKWSRATFDAMLVELSDVATRLPFAATAEAALPYDRTVAVDRNVLYHLFVYLRYLFAGRDKEDQIEPSLRAILADPHRLLTRERFPVDLAAARRIDPAALEELVANREGLMWVGEGITSQFENLKPFKGYLPQRIAESRCESTFDTAENQFIKLFLEMAASVFERMAEECQSESKPTAFTRRTLLEAQELRKQIEPFLRASIWREVRRMTHFPAGSTTLQRRRGYREVLRHFVKLRLAARVPLDPNLVRRLLDARNVAELYELWCFFRLVTELEVILGPATSAFTPQVASTHVHVPFNLGVTWSKGPTVWYNRTFHRSTSSPDRKSYSVTLRPDITIKISSGRNRGIHVFDAKFKLDSLSPIETKADEAEAKERRGDFIRGDLYKMHTYRDAIPDARSVWILYPGSEARFFSKNGQHWSGDEALHEDLSGVGAVPLVPDPQPSTIAPEGAGLRQVLSTLLKEHPE